MMTCVNVLSPIGFRTPGLSERDVPISIFLTAPGVTTYPVELFFGVENDFHPRILASATLVVVLSLGMVLVVQRVVGLEALMRSEGGR